jgi:hypothetical protein
LIVGTLIDSPPIRKECGHVDTPFSHAGQAGRTENGRHVSIIGRGLTPNKRKDGSCLQLA